MDDAAEGAAGILLEFLECLAVEQADELVVGKEDFLFARGLVDEDCAREVHDDVLEAECQLAAVLLGDARCIQADPVLSVKFHGVERRIGAAEEVGA